MSPQIISLTGHAPKVSELVWDSDLSAPEGHSITATTAETATTATNAQKLNNKQESELEVSKAALLKPCQVNNGCVTRIEFDSEAQEMKCWISNGSTEE